jgi:hypothetical protein
VSAVVHWLYAVQEVDADPFAIPPAPFRFVCGSTDRGPTRPLPTLLMVAADPLMRSTTVRRERWNDSATARFPLREIR